MPEGNPLVAQAPEDGGGGLWTAGNGDYGYAGGIGIAESAMDAFNGIKDGNWVEGGLGVLGFAAEAAAAAIDPFGWLLSSVASFLMEHMQPLKDMLDWLAGDPPVIQSYSETWGNVSKALGEVQADYVAAVKSGTSEWTGAAADAYRGSAGEQGEALGGAATVAGAISTVVMIMGEVVAFVRETVRDLIADLVGKLISWVLETVFSLGFGTPVVVAQAVTAISKWAKKISDLIDKLISTIKKVSPLLGKLAEVFTKIIKVLGKLAGKVTGLDVINTKNIIPGGFLQRGGRGGGPDLPGGGGSGGSDSGGSGSPGGGTPSGGGPGGGPGNPSSSSGGPGSGSGGGPSGGGPDAGGGPGSGGGPTGGSPSSAGGAPAGGSPGGGAPGGSDPSPLRSASSGGPGGSGSYGDGGGPNGGGGHPGNTGGGSPSPSSYTGGGAPAAGGGAPHGGGGSYGSGGGAPDSGGPSSSGGGAPVGAGTPHSGSSGGGHGGGVPSGGGTPYSSGGGGGTPHSGGGDPVTPRATDSTGASGTAAPARADAPATPHSGPSRDTAPGSSGPTGGTPQGGQPMAGGGMPPGGGGHPGGGSPAGGGAPGGGRPSGWTGTPGSPAPTPRTPDTSGHTARPDTNGPARGPAHTPTTPGSHTRPDNFGPPGTTPPGGPRPTGPGSFGPTGLGHPMGPPAGGPPHGPGPSGPGHGSPAGPPAGGPHGPMPRGFADAPNGAPSTPGPRGFDQGGPGPNGAGGPPRTDLPGPARSGPDGFGPRDGGSPAATRPDGVDGAAPDRTRADGPEPRHDSSDQPGSQDSPDSSRDNDGGPADHDGNGADHHDQDRPGPDQVNQHHAEGTPSGTSYHANDPDMGDLPHRVQPDPDGRYTVDVHVTPDGRARIGDHTYSPEEFADILRRNGDYDGRPIRLIGCDAGSNDFAQRLSRDLDAPVTAPNKPAWTDSNGRVFSSDYEIGPDGRPQPKIPPNGEWDTHHPDGSTSRASEDGFAPDTNDTDKHDLDPTDAKDRGDADPGDPDPSRNGRTESEIPSPISYHDADGNTIRTDDLLHPNADLLDEHLLRDAANAPSRADDALRPGVDSDHPTVRALVPPGFDVHGGIGEQAWNEEYWPTGVTDRYGNRNLTWPDPEEHPEGFASATDRQPVVLEPGARIDRFGPGFGRFASPPGTSFPDRALPPESLNAGYHTYEVIRPLPTWQGSIAPAMGQQGGGIQYYLPSPVVDLINAGYLREVSL
jgi:hypothetical protein